MKTVLKTLCDDAFFSEDKRLNIIKIIDTISAPTFPATHLHLSFAFILEECEPNSSVKYTFKIADEDNNVIFDSSAMPAEVKTGTGTVTKLIANLQLLPFPKEGKYTATFDFGGLIETVPIMVVKTS